jgi:putative oxygen-independent coproporphyrinogen III oxidase
VSLSLYVHVPFCASRCGYCDFNTYTATELGSDVHRATFHEVLKAEVRYAAQTLRTDASVDTIFFGGGTPTLIGASALTAVLDEIRGSFSVASNAEITTEANPDSVTPQMLDELRAGGFTRMSFGMQSDAPHVLRTLERTHTPGMSVQAAQWARAAGFDHVNLDLIYGTPGETDDDLRRSLDAVLSAEVDHVSAYALIVEDGTALGRRVARGEIPAPDDDVCADRYELVDQVLQPAGLDWYEVSNWAKPGGQCRHNLAYWHNQDWWGIGPGAHSHSQGQRWWNVRHPARYAERVQSGQPPMAEAEELSDEQRTMETVMLGMRLATGLPAAAFDSAIVTELRGQGLVSEGEQLVLTERGRLLADAVIRALLAGPQTSGVA